MYIYFFSAIKIFSTRKYDENIKIIKYQILDLNSTMSFSNNGMISFIDPQKLNSGKNFALDKRSDIYSLGMVLWESHVVVHPFIKKNNSC
jgi:hypothetical protein